MGAVLSNLIIVAVIVVLLSAACIYIYKEKKKGSHCIGCPMAGKCPRKNMCCQTAHKN